MRFATFFSNQACKPTGWFGRWVMANIFDIGNAKLNRLVYEKLSPKPGDNILEIGSGTGKLLGQIVRQVEGCMVTGIDFSDTMVSISRRRNRKHIENGRVTIHKGDIDTVSFSEDMYTKICSVNTIYFWPDPEATARNIVRLLRTGGMLALGFEDIAQLEQRRLDKSVFRLYSTGEVEALLIEAGFSNFVTTESIRAGSSVFHCTVGKLGS
jgi:ubiquinone/menaquinone biosynthesis C-methylase UbiE